MGKVKDLITQIDWETTPSHIIEYDPNLDTEIAQGRNGPFDVIKVKENGVTVFLSLANKSLVRQLKMYNTPTKLKLTREGTSFATKYKVEQVR